MQLTLSAIVYAAFLWWFSTGVIFYLNARPAHTFRFSMLAATVVLALALLGIQSSAQVESVAAAFCAFTCGVLLFGWHTMSYYMGIITGPNRGPCPEGLGLGQRFVRAFATGIYHELAIVATILFVAVMTWGAPNQFALWTFVLLWAMHVSAKLNVFLGIRNLNEEFIPQRLQYLTTYFRKRRMNPLFPFSVTAGTLLTYFLIERAISPTAEPYSAVGYTLVASLMALAVIEHWFMILPIQAEKLWRWSLAPSPPPLSSKIKDREPAVTSVADH
jgi:putative photosynthetic complex assembly protein 2